MNLIHFQAINYLPNKSSSEEIYPWLVRQKINLISKTASLIACNKYTDLKDSDKRISLRSTFRNAVLMSVGYLEKYEVITSKDKAIYLIENDPKIEEQINLQYKKIMIELNTKKPTVSLSKINSDELAEIINPHLAEALVFLKSQMFEKNEDQTLNQKTNQKKQSDGPEEKSSETEEIDSEEFYSVKKDGLYTLKALKECFIDQISSELDDIMFEREDYDHDDIDYYDLENSEETKICLRNLTEEYKKIPVINGIIEKRITEKELRDLIFKQVKIYKDLLTKKSQIKQEGNVFLASDEEKAKYQESLNGESDFSDDYSDGLGEKSSVIDSDPEEDFEEAKEIYLEDDSDSDDDFEHSLGTEESKKYDDLLKKYKEELSKNNNYNKKDPIYSSKTELDHNSTSTNSGDINSSGDIKQPKNDYNPTSTKTTSGGKDYSSLPNPKKEASLSSHQEKQTHIDQQKETTISRTIKEKEQSKTTQRKILETFREKKNRIKDILLKKFKKGGNNVGPMER